MFSTYPLSSHYQVYQAHEESAGNIGDSGVSTLLTLEPSGLFLDLLVDQPL